MPKQKAIVVDAQAHGYDHVGRFTTDQREGYPAASLWSVPVAALYWCDGRRNLAESFG